MFLILTTLSHFKISFIITVQYVILLWFTNLYTAYLSSPHQDSIYLRHGLYSDYKHKKSKARVSCLRPDHSRVGVHIYMVVYDGYFLLWLMHSCQYCFTLVAMHASRDYSGVTVHYFKHLYNAFISSRKSPWWWHGFVYWTPRGKERFMDVVIEQEKL